jgi:arylsulfatase A-like enzyme
MGIALHAGCSETEQSSPARPSSTDASDQKAVASPGEMMRPRLVIVYLIDALRADHLGLYGYPRATSPEIDQLATESVVFDAAYAQASWTRPSVGSLFTGRLPSRHGAVRRSHRLRPDVATLSEVFRDAGYRTAAFFTNPNLLSDFGFDRGFDKYVDIASVGIEADADEVHTAVLEHLDTPAWPQFLYVHTIEPHAPYTPPPPFQKRFIGEHVPAPDDVERPPEARLVLDLYDGEIAYADHALGGFLDALRERGLYDDSLFVLLSDHGEEFLEHGNIRHGLTLFEEQIHIPLLVRFPHARWGGRRVREPVRVVDILPALVDLLGEEAPTGLDGSSFLGLISGSDAIDRRVLFSEQNMDSSVLTSLREGDLKLIKRESPETMRGVELYDLANDPGEREDVSGVRAEEMERLLSHLEAIESSLHGGLYVELNNSSQRRAAGSMQVQLAISGGVFHELAPSGFEDGDRYALSSDGQQLTLDVRLQNRANPTGMPPKWIVDVDRVRIQILGEPDGVRLALTASLDGEQLNRVPLSIGSWSHSAPAPLPWTTALNDEALQFEGDGSRQVAKGVQPYVRIYHVSSAMGAEVEIDEALDARLRALGYVED